MHTLLRVTVLLSLLSSPLVAQVAVFWQPGFPTVSSRPLDHSTLSAALKDPALLDLKALQAPGSLANTQLLVLPYGSAVPTDAWKAIETYLQHGGNLLVLGGQPLRVPVTQADETFVQGRPQDSYSRALDLRHTYEVPVPRDAHFGWKPGYSFGTTPRVQAEKFFTVEGHLNGLGYMVDAAGLLVAAPVIVIDHPPGGAMAGSRIVCLDFQPANGYWESQDGLALIRQSADYARQGSTSLSVETLYSVLRPNEPPQITVHLQPSPAMGEVRVELLSGDRVLAAATLAVQNGAISDLPAPFHTPLPTGFYKIRATYRQQGSFREFYENGFWVADRSSLDQGEALGVNGDFLTRGGKPFFPVGTNYFTTEENGWDFSGPRNASVWEKDFSEMAAHGVAFVRTGVWMKNAKFIEPATGEPNERFLRNLEAFLICAHHHGIAVNFTFFAFSPASGAAAPPADPPPANPYIDEGALRAQQAYVRAVVKRFAKVPWLCWDLINEPSFSNPRRYSKETYPTEMWRK